MPLHNRIDKKILKQQMSKSEVQRKIFSFYKYFPIPDPFHFRNTLYSQCIDMDILGRIYVATEGINAQISVPENTIDEFTNFMNNHNSLSDCWINEARTHSNHSFWVLKIKVRNKIVADGLGNDSMDITDTGKHITAEEFNAFCGSDSNSVILDMRNHYEYEVGHIRNALTTHSDTFREQLPETLTMLDKDKDKNIVMYCTGGIRCEKASAYLKQHGFNNVFQLGGGIIHYHKQVKSQGLKNFFIGKNFVFDQRLGENITDDVISKCHQCGAPSNTHVNCVNTTCHLLFIQCEKCKEKMNGCCSDKCKDFISQSVEVQKQKRKGLKMGRNIFNKSKEKLTITFPQIKTCKSPQL